MPFVPAPNIIQVEWRCTRNGQQIENRLMVDNLAAIDVSKLQDIAILAWDWWENTHAPLLSNGVLLREVVTTDMGEQNGGQFTYAPDATTTGGIVGGALPNECAFCVSLRTASRGRSARGRWYTVSVNQAQMQDNNFLTAAAANLFVSSLNTLRTQISNEGAAAVIVSYRSNNAPRPGGPVYFPITSAVAVDTGIDSQRRRKPGVGS